MTPLDLWQTNQPKAALAAAAALASTGDDRAKLLHFEIAAALGRVGEAAAALRRIERDDDAWHQTRREFRQLLRAIVRRRRGHYGYALDEVPKHLRARRAALRSAGAGDHSSALRLVDVADGCSPTVTGHVDGREFAELRDIDDCFASVLEAIMAGRVLLIPWEQIRNVRLQAAQGLLDTIHRPAEIALTTGEVVAARIPLHYLGRPRPETDRVQYDDGPIRGRGPRMLFTDEEEFTLGDCRRIDVRAV